MDREDIAALQAEARERDRERERETERRICCQ